ncbi:MAG: proline--tRNA ligase [Planctomycetes bacterium]|nr:proline--tRNA ligase [Planctomycetota bacterium]NUQ34349.1 proline--tRNA ligase [Planctomycetaceae bacterium]
MAKNITTRAADYSKWYQDVIKAADLADQAPVRGCMVIKPAGFALWEGIQRDLDRRFKETGHINAYFPLLIPVSFLAKEAKHIEGFAMECAVVTHSGLAKNEKGDDLVVKNELEEPFVVRPTSETVIGHMYAQWVQSWRDLPILINQWANVMRWEMRTRIFLRTSEFLWQEGHTVHETAEEAQEETLRMLDVYKSFSEDFLATPVLAGEKTRRERFPGANHTYTIEAMMQDGKALQNGTSHNLGQNFSKAFNVSFEGRDQKREFAYGTSWGVSTRLIGALIMTHSDDEGLILPPRIAPTLAAIVPIWKNDDERAKVIAHCNRLLAKLCDDAELEAARNHLGQRNLFTVFYDNATSQSITLDLRDAMRPGEKHFHWEQRGVPIRFEIGPRDADSGKLVVKYRTGAEKEILDLGAITRDWFDAKLNGIQNELYERALKYREANTHVAATKDELYKTLETKGGFVRAFLAEDDAFEEKVKADTKATVRLIYQPRDMRAKSGKCIASGKDCEREVVFAVSY